VSTFRYRWIGISSSNLDNLVEAGSGASRTALFRAPFEEVTLADDTRSPELDYLMGQLGYSPDSTGPTVVVTSGPYTVGTEYNVLVNASTGPVFVDLPLTASRLGNDVLVMKIDASTNAVTVRRSGAETIDGQTTQVLDQQNEALLLIGDASTANWHISASRRGSDISYDNSLTTTITATDVQNAIQEIVNNDLTALEVFTAGEALQVGDVLTLNSAGNVIRANSSIAGAIWEVIGVSRQAVLGGSLVEVFTKSGSSPNARFGVVPGAALNGRIVFLDSASGQATTTPPTSNGNTLFTIGTLRGANGVTLTPTIVFRPQFVAFRT